jgi:hypothetical protein
MIHNVFVGDRRHELGSAAIAIVSVLIFGLGFGRVLQLVYGRPGARRPGEAERSAPLRPRAARLLRLDRSLPRPDDRDLVAGAALSALGIVALMFVSSFAMAPWIDFYGTDYAGLGVVMTLFFWVGLSSTVIVLAASLSPVLAGRRIYLTEQAASEGD